MKFSIWTFYAYVILACGGVLLIYILEDIKNEIINYVKKIKTRKNLIKRLEKIKKNYKEKKQLEEIFVKEQGWKLFGTEIYKKYHNFSKKENG